MNDGPLDPIEARLQSLRPAEPPPALMRQLRASGPDVVLWLPWIWVSPLAAAAAWLILAQFTHRGLPPSAPTSLLANSGRPRSTVLPSDFRVFVPVAESSHLINISDLGVVEVRPAQPVRLLKTTWLDDTTFQGDDGHSTLRRTAPREAIIPVALEVF
jgi:hypothetical protein